MAFDRYQALGGNYRWRVRWYIFASLQFFCDSLRQTINNLGHGGTLFKPSTRLSVLQFFGADRRVAAAGCGLPPNRCFHPWQDDKRANAQAYASAHAQDWRLVR